MVHFSWFATCLCKLHISFLYYSTDEDPSLRIESSATINLRGVSTKLNKYELHIVLLHMHLFYSILYDRETKILLPYNHECEFQ